MSTLEFLKEVQKLQLEASIHRSPINISVNTVPTRDNVYVFVQGGECEVLLYESVSEGFKTSDEIQEIYNKILGLTVERQAS